MATRAVITGDIVNSTRIPPRKERKLLRNLQHVLEPNKYEFYRGDSFQVYLKQPEAALLTALLCRAAAVSLSDDEENFSFDVRVAIGIGSVNEPVRTLGAAKGRAFLLSGRLFDTITKTSARLGIATDNPLANTGLEVTADYLNAIFKAMTGKQAQVIFELLNGQTQQNVAGKLKKSKSTINQHVNSGRWPEIEKLLHQYENIINQLP